MKKTLIITLLIWTLWFFNLLFGSDKKEEPQECKIELVSNYNA